MLQKKNKSKKSFFDHLFVSTPSSSISGDSPGSFEDKFLTNERLAEFEKEKSKNKEKTEENCVEMKKLTKSFSSFLLVEKEQEKFKKFAKERFQIEEYNFYMKYKQFINEKNEEKSKLIRKSLFEEFIDENGSSKLTLNFKDRKKVTQKYDNGEKNPFKFVFVDVYNSLNKTYHDLNNFTETEEMEQMNFLTVIEISFPENFDELIVSEGAMKLFSTFVIENYGKSYIECFEELKKIRDSFEEDSKNILEFLNPMSIKNCVHNLEVRKTILLNSKLQKDWYDNFCQHVYHILKSEFYCRFINSITWKNYTKMTNERKRSIESFEGLYHVRNIEKSFDSFSENVEILLVTNKSTSEQYRARRIIATKSQIEEMRINVSIP
jgi:hypothetical protein